MKHPGPLLTLLAGALLAVGIGIADLAAGTGAPSVAGAASAVGAASTTTTAPPATPAPPATTSEPPKPAVPARADYAGKVTGGGASIAVSARDGDAIAYVCDGKKLEAWLQGVTAGGKLDLKGAPDAALTGSFDATSATGTVTAAGKTYRFTVPAAKKPAGLYRAAPKVKGKAAKVGWIVQPDGSQVGILTTEEGPAAAPPLDPAAATATVDGAPVTAEAISGLAGNGDF
jgi:serine/threonine-protein kinase